MMPIYFLAQRTTSRFKAVLNVSATHEEKSGGSVSRREFSRTVDLPSDVQVNLMRSIYSRDGVLSITAPISQVNNTDQLAETPMSLILTHL